MMDSSLFHNHGGGARCISVYCGILGNKVVQKEIELDFFLALTETVGMDWFLNANQIK